MCEEVYNKRTEVDGKTRVQRIETNETKKTEKVEDRGSDGELYQPLASHLYRISNGLFGLIPQSAEQSRVPLVSTNGQSPPNLFCNAFVTTSRELSAY
jgi:hypothetical protein